jgi:D-alanyl-D-alanine carboxypeptidase (penicillin-binding protein 5/6)
MLAGRNVALTMPRSARRDMKVKVIYENPVPAPVATGAPLGRILITAPGQTKIEIPLIAGASVERLGPSGRVSAALKYLLWGKSTR